MNDEVSFIREEKDVFKKIEERYPYLNGILKIKGVFVAGGFLRDLFLGLEPDDIDVFSLLKLKFIK